jgi:hypothetical protein
VPEPVWWIFSAGDLIALFAAAAIALVAIVAIIVTRLNARDATDNVRALGDTDHQYWLGLAREDREQARLKAVYEDLVTTVLRSEWTVNRTAPVMEPGPAPPEPLSDEKFVELNARTAIHGSADMLDALREFEDARQRFFEKVRVRGEYLKTADIDPDHRRKAAELWGEAENIRRDEVRPAARRIEEVAREDLQPRSKF